MDKNEVKFEANYKREVLRWNTRLAEMLLEELENGHSCFEKGDKIEIAAGVKVSVTEDVSEGTGARILVSRGKNKVRYILFGNDINGLGYSLLVVCFYKGKAKLAVIVDEMDKETFKELCNGVNINGDIKFPSNIKCFRSILVRDREEIECMGFDEYEEFINEMNFVGQKGKDEGKMITMLGKFELALFTAADRFIQKDFTGADGKLVVGEELQTGFGAVAIVKDRGMFQGVIGGQYHAETDKGTIHAVFCKEYDSDEDLYMVHIKNDKRITEWAGMAWDDFVEAVKTFKMDGTIGLSEKDCTAIIELQ